jgi:hypothetical protein
MYCSKNKPRLLYPRMSLTLARDVESWFGRPLASSRVRPRIEQRGCSLRTVHARLRRKLWRNLRCRDMSCQFAAFNEVSSLLHLPEVPPSPAPRPVSLSRVVVTSALDNSLLLSPYFAHICLAKCLRAQSFSGSAEVSF